MNDNRILITGAAGFIGSALAHYYNKFEPESCTLALDKFRSNKTFSNGNLQSFGHFKNLLGFNGLVLEGDITKKETLSDIMDFKPSVIYHEAAISDTTVAEQDELIRVNLNAFKDLLEICRKTGSKIVYASSGATYGNAPSPQTVGVAESPRNAYGFSKLMMDKMAKIYSSNFGVHAVGLRYFNVYGKGEFFKNKTASMVLQFGLQILSGRAPILFEGSDKIMRDFIYIDDVLQANLLSLKAKSGVYNVGSGKARSFQDIADILQQELGTNYGNEYISNPFVSQYQFHTQADIEPTKKELGYNPKFSLEEGIKAYLPEIKRIFAEEING